LSAAEQAARRRARARVWTASKPRIEALTALSELFAVAALTCDHAIDDAAEVLAQALADAIVIDVLTPERDWMYPLGVHAPDPARRNALTRIRGIPFRADHGFTAPVLDSGDTLLFPCIRPDEIRALQPEIAPLCEALDVTGFAIAPLIALGHCTGFLWQLRSGAQPRLCEDDGHFLHEAGIRVALGIESWRRQQGLRLSEPDAGDVADDVALECLLTPTERAVHARIAQDDDDDAIARRLELSPRTVEWYRRRIQTRLGATDHATLLSRARAHRVGRGSAVVDDRAPHARAAR
jgi:DNA-binding CsgD family transcriptional regulator